MELCQEVGVSFEAVPAKVGGPKAHCRMSFALSCNSTFIFLDRKRVSLQELKSCGQKMPG